jgi:hypothetical protein
MNQMKIMHKKMVASIGIGIIVTFLIYLGLQNSLRVPALFSAPMSSESAIKIIAQHQNFTQYSIFDFSTRYVYIKGDGAIFESDANSNLIGKYLGRTEPTITTGNYFAWEVRRNSQVYFVDSVTGEIISKSS